MIVVHYELIVVARFLIPIYRASVPPVPIPSGRPGLGTVSSGDKSPNYKGLSTQLRKS